MKAWLLESIGSLDHLRLGEAPDPTPGVGEAVLEVEFASLNPADRFLAEGQYPARPPLPHVLGRDAIGVVSAVGQGVEGVQVGDRRLVLRTEVGVTRRGTFAERVAVPVVSLVEPPARVVGGAIGGGAAGVPDGVPGADDVGRGVAGRGAGDGGVGRSGGGVGTTRRAMGHTVIALSRNPQKAERLEQLGAHRVFDPNGPDWTRELTEALRGRRVDLVVDNIGGPLFTTVLETLAEHGRVSCVGRLAGPVPQFNTASLFFRRIKIGGVAVGAYTPAEAREAWADVLKLLSATGARPLVDSVWEFGQLREAFERLAQGPMGKVVSPRFVGPAVRDEFASPCGMPSREIYELKAVH